jgi:hypothetical protein
MGFYPQHGMEEAISPVRQPKSNPKHQYLEPILNDLALFEATSHAV